MEIANLSSNWKKIQKTLQKGKCQAEDKAEKSLKRKHTAGAKPNGITKKVKVHATNGTLKVNRTKMGSYFSREQPGNGTTAAPSAQLQPHSSIDIAKVPFDDDNPTSALLKPLSEPFISNQGFYPAATSQKNRYVALDCEMVGIGPPPYSDSQLARVSITNYHGDVLYDSYVLPVLPVTDYRTHVSGIAEEHLQEGVARSFKMVQDDVKGLLNGRILVAHAVKNDLQALIINHPKQDIRDTSKYPPYREIAGGRSPALKRLADTFLGIKIQQGEHSSVVDARATMALYRREKDGFEREAVRHYGVRKEVKPDAAAEEEREERDEMRREKQRIRNKKKKKRKK
ncbi:hypothetical protein EJ05DRAFT_230962 [Pseudovirgaria hyperparasitica]|uniref:RNA exonuclease 4 n=1 Tax=Pseudovirgaria hyperparasitica TaxID=470096 RepID=A0A6A6VS61_9PEZI|nr:uncharacterized protein EJ05DRAFT_230962 [Pseudovirgaria hyperparasitica]KAF2753053.1 hypothetical protein EJ05DRAFT_230962 [Pseudovirgaria hyperparasitica]